MIDMSYTDFEPTLGDVWGARGRKGLVLQAEMRAGRGRRRRGRGGRLATTLRNKPAGFDCNVPASRPRLPILLYNNDAIFAVQNMLHSTRYILVYLAGISAACSPIHVHSTRPAAIVREGGDCRRCSATATADRRDGHHFSHHLRVQ